MSEADLPQPPYPADTDLRKLDWVKVWRRRLLESDTWVLGPSVVRGAAMTLWLACLDLVPAGSLPADDELNRIRSGASPEEWAEFRARIMGGWRLHQDGRLYHRVVSEVVLDAIGASLSGKKAAAARWSETKVPGTRSQRLSHARTLGTHTRAEWVEMLRIFGGRCVACWSRAMNVEKEHVKPVSAGGSDAIENLQPMCAPCNASKGGSSEDHRSSRVPDWLEKIVKYQEDNPGVCATRAKRQRRASATPRDRDSDSERERKTPPTPLAGGGAEVVGFDTFWRVYPRRVGKLAAAKSYERACKLTTPAAIQAAVEAFARASLTKDQQYLPHPATWLNQGRWSDEGPGLAPRASGAHGAKPAPNYTPLGVGG